ncbi:MAG TPA: sugar ABC transporter permease [Clostridiaceae bacterium]|nr:sugar ABC transporter permease [Clostridiaceae bacterium]
MKNFLKIPNYSNYKHNDNNFRQNNSLSISSKNCKPGKVKAASDTLLKRIHKHRALYIFMLPAIIYVAIFYYGPMYGIQIAFKDYNSAFGIWNSKWVGFKHFKDFFGGYYFGRLIKNTFAISFYSLIDFPIQIIVALMLNEIRNYKYKKFVQTVLYAPHFISTVVMVGIVTTMLSPSIGVVNHIIELLGYERQYFIIQPAAFRHIYVWSGVWQEMGWGAIIYLAALSNVDIQLHEAATIDGASRMQRIKYINIPTITPTIVIMLILRMGRIATVGYEKAFLLQNDLNIAVSEIISTYVYRRGLVGGQYSFSTAVGLFNNVLNIIMLLIANAISRKISETSLF